MDTNREGAAKAVAPLLLDPGPVTHGLSNSCIGSWLHVLPHHCCIYKLCLCSQESRYSECTAAHCTASAGSASPGSPAPGTGPSLASPHSTAQQGKPRSRQRSWQFTQFAVPQHKHHLCQPHTSLPAEGPRRSEVTYRDRWGGGWRPGNQGGHSEMCGAGKWRPANSRLGLLCPGCCLQARPSTWPRALLRLRALGGGKAPSAFRAKSCLCCNAAAWAIYCMLSPSFCKTWGQISEDKLKLTMPKGAFLSCLFNTEHLSCAWH